MAESLALLTRSRVIQAAHIMLPERHFGLRLGDQLGLLERSATEPLVSELASLVTPGAAAIAVGNGVADVLLGYLVASVLDVSLVSVSNQDGVVTATGSFPQAGSVWLFAMVVDEPALLTEFEVACRRAGAVPEGAITGVDRLVAPNPRVHSLVRWSDHSWDPSECPICRVQP